MTSGFADIFVGYYVGKYDDVKALGIENGLENVQNGGLAEI
jgi:hypothetical protein